MSEETDKQDVCAGCGAPIPSEASMGICPKCLAAGAGSPEPSSRPASSRKKFQPPAPEELNGLIDDIEIECLIGRGGMGAVYKGRQTDLDREVAIKVLPPELTESDPAFGERFRREARAMAKLHHPNIVSVFAIGETANGHCYYIMEYVEGADLDQVLGGTHLSPEQALALVPQICDALQFAHEKGVVHRDIKPSNILVTTGGQVKIADFGLAKLYGEVSEASEMLTMTNQVLGTPSYMAPEQRSNPEQTDHRADIYSLGVVFYQMLTGQLPQGIFPPPSKKVQVDVRIDEVVLHALASEPEKRYQHASEIKTDVEAVTGHQTRVPLARAGSIEKPTKVLADDAADSVAGKTTVAGENAIPSESPAASAKHAATIPRWMLPAGVVGVLVVVAFLVIQPLQKETPVPGSAENPQEEPVEPAKTIGGEPLTPPSIAREVDYSAAMARLQAKPESVKAEIEAALGQLQKDNPRLRNFRHELEVSAGKASLDLSRNHALLDLTALRGLPLTELDVSYCLLDELEPLRGMPLRSLDLSETDVVDLAPLEGMSLEVFKAARQVLQSTAVLEGMPLQEVTLEHVIVHNDGLEFLRGSDVEVLDLQLSALNPLDLQGMQFREINVAGTGISDLKWLDLTKLEKIVLTPGVIETGLERLRDAPKLKAIGVWELGMRRGSKHSVMFEPEEFWRRYEANQFRVTPASVEAAVTDAIERLKGDNPEQKEWNVQFDISRTGSMLELGGHEELTDLSALRGLALYRIDIPDTKHEVRDLSPLRGMPLEWLRLGVSKVTDLEPLRGMPLRYFAYAGPASDFGALLESPLHFLSLEGSGIRKVPVLGGLPLRELNVRNCPHLSDLSSLSEVCVRTLDLGANDYPVDLSLLAGMPLRRLILSSSRVRDLGPLRTMPLVDLSIAGTQVTDLDPLRGVRLEYFFLQDTGVPDISPIEGMPLKRFGFSPQHTMKGIEVLRGIKTLEQIDGLPTSPPTVQPTEFWARYSRGEFRRHAITEALEQMKEANPEVTTEQWAAVVVIVEDDRAEIEFGIMPGLTDLSAMEGMPLTKIAAESTRISDLSPLRGMPLRDLFLPNNQGRISDLQPLKGMSVTRLDLGYQVSSLEGLAAVDLPLEELSVAGPELRDLGPLRGMQLRSLVINESPIKDLSPLEGMRLEHLFLRTSEAIDLQPIKKMQIYGSLRIHKATNKEPVDLGPLQHLQVKQIELLGFPIGSLEPLRSMSLEGLNIPNTGVSDLSALAGMETLRSLNISGTPVIDLSPLNGLRLRSIKLNPARIESGLEALKNMPTLERIHVGGRSDMALKEFWESHAKAMFDAGRKIREGIEALKEANPDQEEWKPHYEVGLNSVVLELRDHANLQDISPLEGSPLTTLSLVRSRVSDLSALTGMALRSLDIRETQVTSIEPLRSMQLEHLDTFGTRITDWTPLRNQKLKQLVCLEVQKPPEWDLLDGMPLERLEITVVESDLARLRDYKKLRNLVIDADKIDSLAPLEGMHLTKLTLSVGPSDGGLSPLKKLRLKTLVVLDGRTVTDLSPLAGMPLLHLDLRNCQATDLGVLAGMPLKVLRLENSAVAILAPLRGMQMDLLDISGSEVSDLAVLGDVSVERLEFDPWRIKQGMEELQANQSVKWIRVEGEEADLSAEEFWKRWNDGKYRTAPRTAE